jgi:phage terminase small subunit
MPGEKALTPKQAAFARAYLEHGNASLAYKLHYNSANGMNENTIKRNAHALLHNPKVQAELEKLRAPLNNKTTTTLEDLVAEQDEAIAIARESKQAAALSAASMAKAKLLGMLVDRAEVRTGAIDPDEAKPDIAQLWARVASPALPQDGTDSTKH